MAYDGFISYSHAADDELAPALQRSLQRLAKPWYRRRALEVFRDKTGLSVDPHLWGAIVTAMDDADWFLLLTSPEAAGSPWVNREIEHWTANRPVDHILPVVTSGRWEWDDAARAFTEDSDAVPPALKGVFTAEPRHLDLRWARDESQLDLRNSRFRDAVAELAAPLHGRAKDDLEGEDVRQHRRTIRIAWAAAGTLAVLLVVALIGTVVAVRNADRAEQRRVEADAQRLVAQSSANLDQPDLAFLLAAHADQLDRGVDTRGSVLSALATRPEFRRRIPVGAPVTAVSYVAADDLVVVGTADGDLILYRYSNGERVGGEDQLVPGAVRDLAVAGAGDDLRIFASDEINVATLDAAAQVTTVRTLAPDLITSIAVTDDGDRLATGLGSGDVALFEGDEEDPSVVFAAHEGEDALTAVTAVAWTGGENLLSAGQDGTVRYWDTDAGPGQLWVIDEPTTSTEQFVTTLATLPNDLFATGGSDGTVGFWSVATGAETEAGIVRLHSGAVNELAATGEAADNGSLASVGADGQIIYWNDRTGFALLPTPVHRGGATALAWDPSDPQRGATGGDDGSVLLLDYGPDRRVPVARLAEGWSDPSAVALSPDGDRLAVAGGRGITTTSAASPDPDDPTVEIDDIVEQLRFAPDGTTIVAGLSDGSLVTWNGTDEPIDVDAHDGPVLRLAVSPDGSMVASGGFDPDGADLDRSTVRLWTLDDGVLTAARDIDAPAQGFGLAFFADGTRLAIGGRGAVAVHDLGDGSTREADLDLTSVRELAVNSDGDLLAVATFDGAVRLFDPDTMEETADPLRHPGLVTGVAFEPAGATLVTTAADGGFRVWSVESGEPLAPALQGHFGATGPALAVAGEQAATASQLDDRVITWPLTIERWIADGCELHGRELTEAEAVRFDLEEAPPVCTDG